MSQPLMSQSLRTLTVLSAVIAVALVWAAPARADLYVTLEHPNGMEAVFGSIEVQATVSGDEDVASVQLKVDGRSLGTLSAPPFVWTVDVGQDNREHRFEVLARGSRGGRGNIMVTTPAIQIDDEVAVELQQLYVTVTNGDRRVLDLPEAQFRIFDDGDRQEMVTFARGDVALAAVLLIDSSESMRGERMEAALRGARAFSDALRERDEVALMLFSDHLNLATPFTHDSDVLLEALGRAEVGGDTAINDHLYLALKLLDARQGRRVIVLFTDGADLNSVLDMDEVIWKARRSQALVYWIRLEDGRGHSSFATAWRDAQDNRRQLDTLERTVEQSGGRILMIETLNEVEPAFREIVQELREQYVLGYYPSKVRNDDSWHDVDVKVDRGGLRVRTRGGYVDF